MSRLPAHRRHRSDRRRQRRADADRGAGHRGHLAAARRHHLRALHRRRRRRAAGAGQLGDTGRRFRFGEHQARVGRRAGVPGPQRQHRERRPGPGPRAGDLRGDLEGDQPERRHAHRAHPVRGGARQRGLAAQASRGRAAKVACRVVHVHVRGKRTKVRCKVAYAHVRKAHAVVRVSLSRGRHVAALGHARLRHGRATVMLRPIRKLRRGRATITLVAKGLGTTIKTVRLR
jgi:hypothetical protein